MKRILSVALILLLSASTLASCNPDTGSESATETQTEMPTGTVTEPGTDAPTEPPTEASAEPSDTEAPDPLETPVRVGTGYDGKTACYDGRLRHMYESFSTSYGGTFDSVQEAMDSLAGMGGAISAAFNGDIGLCLSVKVGCTFDDGNGGYAYYSALNTLDDMAEDLDGCHVYVWSEEEGLEPGYYLMTWVGNGKGTVGRNYRYDKEGDLAETWEGLPKGESYFD